MVQELQDRASKKQEEDRAALISTRIKSEKEKKAPKFNEKTLREELER